MASSFDMELETPELETLSSLAQHLVYRLPHCDDNIIRLTLREVYRDFCRRSCCLRVRRRFYGPVFRLPVVFGGSVLSISVVRDGCRCLSIPRDYTYANGNVLVSHRHEHGVEVEWVEVPPLSCEDAPKWLIERYGDALCSGVLARLLAQANKPWSDPQMAVIEGQRYEAVVGEVCQGLYTDSMNGSLGTVFDTSAMI